VRALRVLLATLVLATGVLVGPLAPAGKAIAAEPDAMVSIRLDSFSPSLPKRNSELTITGQVTNTSKKRLFRPRAYFWRNQAPITDSEGFDQALDSDANDPLGARYIPAFDNLFDDDDPYLDAGDSAGFTLRVKLSDLALSPTPGIYLMGVHVLQNETSPAVGRARLFVPVLSKAPRNSLQMTTVVALSSRPSLVSPGLFSDDHLAAEVAPGGRLDVLLSAADQKSVSFAVDPALVDELEAMRSGYRVLDPDGDPEDGTGGSDAGRWLNAFSRLSASHDGYRLLYGSVDVAAVAHAGKDDVLQASQAAAKTVAATSSLPLLVWPGGGVADLPTVAAAEALEPAAILLSDSATRAEAPLLQGLRAPGVPRADIVNYTSAAFGGGPGPEPSDTPVHLQQRMLAEGWLHAATEPEGTTLGRVRVVSTAAQAKSDDESVRAPWIRQTTLTQLLKSNPARWDGALHYTDDNRGKELDAAQLSGVDRLSRSWSTWADLLTDRGTARASADAAVARATSFRLRGKEEEFGELVDPQLRTLDSSLDQIQISATRRLKTPKSKVFFPITIRNRLPQPSGASDPSLNTVSVKLVFTSDNSQRLTVQPIPLTSIAAGQNFTSNAVVDARTNGTVRVTAQLYTASNQPVGRPKIIDVTATQAGTVGWFIAIGAGIVLVGTTALRIRQVTRERARAAAQAGSAPLDATRSAPAQDVSSPGAGQNTSESIDV
jgi:hypothetical protein